MDNDTNAWLEQEYQEFERQFLALPAFWRAAAQTLRGTRLYSLFESFARTFPDHPSDVNTVFYLVESVSQIPVSQEVWLWCSHFEHQSLEDLRNLVTFMDEGMRVLSSDEDCARVEMLDSFRERIVLSFYFPRPDTVELLKARGVRGVAK